MNISDYRKQIDDIDSQIIDLYHKRMAVSKKVGEFKLKTGMAVYDKGREEEKINYLSGMADNDFDRQAISELFEQIMAISRKYQYRQLSAKEYKYKAIEKLNTEKSRVIFQGAEGAYSQAAMEEYFGTRIESFNVGTFEEAMQLVSDNKADYAVLPLENSIAGVVTEVYDLLAEYDNFIVAEQEILIEHCLLGIPGSRVEEINTIYSHPMSLLQSSGFLNEHPEWQKIACENNAFAARKVKELNDSKSAAIAGAKAAAVYGLEVIKENISRSALNTTRFIIISGRKDYRMTADKISICFEVPHQSGSLYHMLSHFIFNNLNMNRIESRPIPDRDWEYRFFVDFTGNLTDAAVINALHGLSLEAVNLKILGNY